MITGNPYASSNDARLTAARRPVLACYKAKNKNKNSFTPLFNFFILKENRLIVKIINLFILHFKGVRPERDPYTKASQHS